MIIPLEVVSDFIHENCDRVKVTGNGTHFNARCPLCGDSKKSLSKRRFHVDWNNGNPGYHCFNCGRSGHFLELYALLKGKESAYEAEKEIRNIDNIQDIIQPTKKVKPTEKSTTGNFNYILNDCLSTNSEPKGYIEKSYQRVLFKFIEDRKIGDYPIYVAYKGKYKGRIIIPVFGKGDIIYFQGRRISDEMEPKYLNPPVEKENIILNKEKFDRDKHIIVTEGILDALRVGNQGTTILGSELSRKLLKKLEKLTDKDIIICLDNDKPGKEKIYKLLKENFSKYLFFFKMPDKYLQTKDIDRLYLESSIKNMYQFIVDNSYSYFDIMIKLKMGV